MTVAVLGHSFAYEVENVVRLFFPGERMRLVRERVDPCDIVTELIPENGRIRAFASINWRGFCGSAVSDCELALDEATYEHDLCLLLFQLLCEKTGKVPPWGMLTGVRPVRLVRERLDEGLSEEEALRWFSGHFGVTEAKARLAVQVARAEQSLLAGNAPRDASLYIGIPFCPTRCLYCSFVSHAIDRAAALLPDYLRLLHEELRVVSRLARECGLTIRTVYVGGGTPTTLSAQELSALLGAVAEHFDLSGVLEYTVEAGRPDTLLDTEGGEKLAVLRKHAGRVSINPQTMDDETLRRIGRAHTASETVKAYEGARKAGFRSVNMDLIAGLPSEPPESFLSGLRRVIGLSPENITVHTLTVKRSSHLREHEDAFSEPEYDLSALLDQASSMLTEAGYSPYYLYRQKGTRQNLENVGYAKPGHECLYNVYMMEEAHTVLAAGAGGVTKLCAPPGRIKRVFNFKYPYEYTSRFEELIARKDTVKLFF